MKKINNFFDKAAMWKVYIASYLMICLFVFATFQFFKLAMTEDGKNLFTFIVILKVSLTISILLSLIVISTVSMMRSSNRFWSYAKEVEKLIEDADSKELLKEIHKNELKKLHDMSGGQPHHSELTKLYAILETKGKYVK